MTPTLLGTADHGLWAVAPRDEVVAMRRRYRGPTLVLETEFEAPRGTARLVDCMRLRGSHPRVERVVEGVRGEVPMLMRFVPRFDSGRVIPEERRARTILVRGQLWAPATPT
jgi:hypothetical protein